MRLTVLPRPELQDLKVSVPSPAHTGLAPFDQRNEGDLDVPEGSQLRFQLGTRHAGTRPCAGAKIPRTLSRTWTTASASRGWPPTDLTYAFHPRSQDVSEEDSVRYRLRTIADRRPTIRVLEVPDSLSLNRIAFNGIVQDDYGFTVLRFVHRIRGGDAESLTLDRPSDREDGFIHLWDLTEAGIGLGDEVEYWFEVRDNDGVNGPKMTRSRTFVHQAPTAEELAQQLDSADTDTDGGLGGQPRRSPPAAGGDARIAPRAHGGGRARLGGKSRAGGIAEATGGPQGRGRADAGGEPQEERDAVGVPSPMKPCRRSRRSSRSLMDEVMTDELQQMFDELREMMEQLEEGDKEKIEEQLEQMDLDQEALEQELDRALEQFKQLQWEQKMEEAISDLEKLAEEQEKLAEETEPARPRKKTSRPSRTRSTRPSTRSRRRWTTRRSSTRSSKTPTACP